jgi:deoxycytidylate deaminase
MVETAKGFANQSPCQKSKRGAVVFDPADPNAPPLGVGYNGRPDGGCEGDETCRRDCGKICVHAEQRAIYSALAAITPMPRRVRHPFSTLDILHVKTVDGVVVPGGPPSCWQCSKAIVDTGIAGVWLYEHDATTAPGSGVGDWIRYTATGFHDLTLKVHRIHPFDRPQHRMTYDMTSNAWGCSCGYGGGGDEGLVLHIAMVKAAGGQ